MGLFTKDKGLILSILNAIFVIWIVGACVSCITNVSNILIKDHQYTYDEYQLISCDMEYDTEDVCLGYYTLYINDEEMINNEYVRNLIISVANILLVAGTLVLVNKDKKSK